MEYAPRKAQLLKSMAIFPHPIFIIEEEFRLPVSTIVPHPRSVESYEPTTVLVISIGVDDTQWLLS